MGGEEMRGIAGLLGRDAGRLLDLILGESEEEREMTDRVRRSARWCGTTPGRGSAGGQGAGPERGPRRARGGQGRFPAGGLGGG